MENRRVAIDNLAHERVPQRVLIAHFLFCHDLEDFGNGRIGVGEIIPNTLQRIRNRGVELFAVLNWCEEARLEGQHFTYVPCLRFAVAL
ncbi:hypothetical protein D3C80_1102090 [compost metagenome]